MSCQVRLGQRVNIVVAHAPHAHLPETEKDTFYEHDPKRCDQCANRNTRLVVGDFNAKLIEPTNEEEREAMGRRTLKV